MSVDIGQALEEGGKRTVSPNGLYFVAIIWVLGVLSSLFSNSIARQAMGDMPRAGQAGGPFGPPTVGPTLGISPTVAGLLSLVVGLVSLVVSAAAVRTFVTEETETIPGEHFTRNLLWMVLNLIVGGVVFAIVIVLGFVALIIPGIFLLVSLFFWNVYVIVEDQNFIDGFQSSWAATKGNRIMLFVLGVLVAIVYIVVGAVFGAVGAFLPAFVALAVSQIGGAFASVFGVATAARTYLQLEAEEPSPAG